MRENKFRAWAIEHKRRIDPSNISISGDGNIHCIEKPFSMLSPDAAADKIKIEWFTGLKDKNGVEIYEGDMVVLLNFTIAWKELPEYAIEVDRTNQSVWWYSPISSKYVVRYIEKDAGFFFTEARGSSGRRYSWRSKSWKVIGNNHENPELETK